MKKLIYIGLLSFMVLSSCKKDRTDKVFYQGPITCNQEVVVNDSLFIEGVSDAFTIVNAMIEGDCMKVEYYARGCDGSTWNPELITEENDWEEDFVYARMLLENTESCADVYSKMVTYDLRPMRVSSTESVYIELAGWNRTLLLYNYE